MSDSFQSKPPFPVLAMLLAFVPAGLVLAFFSFGGDLKAPLLAAALLLTIGCCTASSLMLFRHQTGLALVAAVLFLILNGLISLFFGCACMLRS